VGGTRRDEIMLISVTERTQEMRAQSHRRAPLRHVPLQFLLEAVVLTLVGGTIGILIDAGVSATVRTLIPRFPQTLSYLWVTIGSSSPSASDYFFGSIPRTSRRTLTHCLSPLRMKSEVSPLPL